MRKWEKKNVEEIRFDHFEKETKVTFNVNRTNINIVVDKSEFFTHNANSMEAGFFFELFLVQFFVKSE